MIQPVNSTFESLNSERIDSIKNLGKNDQERGTNSCTELWMIQLAFKSDLSICSSGGSIKELTAMPDHNLAASIATQKEPSEYLNPHIQRLCKSEGDVYEESVRMP